MYLWYLEKIWRKSANPDTKKVSGTKLCRHDLAESAKSADFWLSGRHVADMSATFPAKIPKISTTLQELEGFTYATALDLNMGYYTIRLDPKAVEMFTIIFPWGKYSYLTASC